MSVKVLPPTPAPPPKPGYVRHQFLLVLDEPAYKAVLENKNVEVSPMFDLLTAHFGGMAILVEKVMEGDHHGWHVWVDYAEEDESYYFAEEK